MTPLAEEKGLTVLEPSGALDANGFYVTQEFAEQNDLTTLSDLGALGQPVTHRGRRRVHRAAVLRHRPHRDLRHPGGRRHR